MRRRHVTRWVVGTLVGLGALSLFAVAAVARWNSTATMDLGDIQIGTLDVTVGSATEPAGLFGLGGTMVQADLGIVDLIPGESQARLVHVHNSGTAPLDFTVTAHTTNNGLVSGGAGLLLEVRTAPSGVSNSGSAPAGSRAGSCSGGTTTVSDLPVSTTPQLVTGSIPLPQTDDVVALCVRTTLHHQAPGSMQATSTELILTIDALQAAP